VQVDDFMIASLLAEIIEVLCQMQNLRSELFADAGNHLMGCIRPNILHAYAKLITEPVNQLGMSS
jgi:hypothetical protein